MTTVSYTYQLECEIRQLKEKLEKIKVECDKEPKAYISASFIKEILQ